MYTMKADGVLFHDPSANDPSRMAMGTEAKFELNKAGSLTFTLPPDNLVYHSLRKRKSVVQLYQDGEMLFQGRVLEVVTDLQNMQEVYCEGELMLLADSVQPAMDFDGTAEEYLRQAISNHNAVMEADKHFVVGTVTAVEEKHKVKVKSTDYTDTLGDLRSLLVDEFGGYLRVRYSGSTRYLDYIKEYTDYSGQSVKFGVNLVDIEKRVDTQKFFTILLPLGKVESGKRTTIAQVNGGSIYLEDVAAVSQYGRIIQTVMFEKVNDPQELLEKAQEYLARMRENRSVTVRAVDMKIVNPDIDSILLGDRVMLDSLPHDLNEYDICAKVVLLIDAPDQSEYTFGIPPDPLTDQVASRIKQTNKSVDNLKDWLTVTDTELILAKQHIADNGNKISNVMIELDAVNATILLKADQTVVSDLETRVSNAEILIDGANAAIDLKADRTIVTDLETRMSAAEILIDGANAAIELKAAQLTVDELSERLSQAEIDIDGANAQINLKASKTTVDALGERVSTAELLIDGQNSLIEAKADNVRVEALETEITGLLKVENLQATIASLPVISNGMIQSDNIDSTHIECQSLDVNASLSVGSSMTIGGKTAATQYWVESQGYLKADASNIATRSWVIEQNYTTASDVSQTLDGYVMTGELEGYATEAWVRENFSKASATYKPTVIERYGSVSGNNIPVQALNEAGTVLLTGTVDAGDVYSSGVSSGKNSVTLTATGWQGSTYTINASNGRSAVVSLPTFSVSGGTSFNSSNQTTVYFSTPSVSGYLASKTVDASSVYQLGYTAGQEAGGSGKYDEGYAAGYADAKPDSVSLMWNYSSSSNYYIVDISVVAKDGTNSSFTRAFSAQSAYDAGYAAGLAAGGGSSAAPDIVLASMPISNNQLTVYAYDNTSGKVFDTETYDLTSVYNNGWNACRDACTLATSVYTIKEYAPGTLYLKISSDGQTYYSSVGSDWVRTSAATAYNRPAAKS